MLSIIIPARNEIFLQKTIDDLLIKATGDIEIIVILDGYWPITTLKDNPKLKIIHRGKSMGMRSCINSGVAISSGEYLMKLDAHCMVDKGFDEKLINESKKNWIQVPTRKRLDAKNWCVQKTSKPDINYMYLTTPNEKDGYHAVLWEKKNKDPELKKILIDDLMTFQGSCWFMEKSYFYELELMDEKNYGEFGNEAQELGFKCWLSGGRVIRNKKVWYAHLHKGREHGRGYFLNKKTMKKAKDFTNKWGNNTAWDKNIYDVKWLLEKFKSPTWQGENMKDVKLPLQQGENMKDVKLPLQQGENMKDELKLWYEKSQQISPVRIYKFKRKNLLQLFNKYNYTIGAEIGVAEGKFSEEMCKVIKDINLTSIDTWSIGGDMRSKQIGQPKADERYLEASEKLKNYNCVLIKNTSIEASKNIKNNSLDFVYIDACHEFDYVMEDLITWGRKVKKNGVISGHDFYRFKNSGVIEAVELYTKMHKIDKWFITDERTPSWWFIKE